MALIDELRLRLESLKRARDTGAETVKKGDDLTTFRSLSELNEIIADLEGQIGIIEGGGTVEEPRIKTLRFHTSDGW